MQRYSQLSSRKWRGKPNVKTPHKIEAIAESYPHNKGRDFSICTGVGRA